MIRLLLPFCYFLFSISFAFSQSAAKKSLDHTVYDSWQSIQGERISNNGQWAVYEVNCQEGDGSMVIADLPNAITALTIPRGVNARISDDSEYVVLMIKPQFAKVRQAKIKKKKKEDMPKDSLAIIHLSTRRINKFPRVKSFKIPEKGSGFVAYHLEKLLPQADTSKTKDTTRTNKVIKDATDSDDDKKADVAKEEGTDLVLRNLKTGAEARFTHVVEYNFSKSGKKLLIVTVEKFKDTTAVPGVYLVDTETFNRRTILKGKGKYKLAVLDEAGEQVAFLADRDTTKAKQRFFNLYYWNPAQETAYMVADTATPGMPAKWSVSEHSKVYFSDDGKRLFFGTSPILPPADTSIIDFEVPSVDVWNWQDAYLQPQQVKNREEDLKRNYLALILLSDKKKKMVQLATKEIPVVIISDKGKGTLALGLSDLPYRYLTSWEGNPARQDVYVVDVATGNRQKVLENLRASVTISPKGNYLLWYDAHEHDWYSYAIQSGRTTNLTEFIPASFSDEENDVPDDPGSYGYTAWTTADKYILVCDKYDIWQLDPQMKEPARNLTNGRPHGLRYRYVRTDPEEQSVKPGSELLLRIFHWPTKQSGFASLVLDKKASPQSLVLADYYYSYVAKAKQANTHLFSRSTFTDNPDLYVSKGDFANAQKLSHLNPQQKEYWWGSAELVQWRSAEGKPMEGLLYKPENFDPHKKYPMLVYFYERSSDQLHMYFSPSPSASTINRPFFTSRGYLVFVPDISYTMGYPGKSAQDAIVPGVLKLVEQGFVDSDNIGIQGQSWGGYQVAYLVTRTNMFKAAMAGAPVSNMTSAYGGIRWETGMSRMFQYEKTQSRIGATLWEKPMLYLENSPLFRADYVQTPLLMMHNDADGAVPWYQGIEMFVALRRLGKPVWMLTYNREAHNLVERRNRKDLSIRMQQFFDHYLKGEPEPVWMKYGVPATEKGKSWGYDLVPETEPGKAAQK